MKKTVFIILLLFFGLHVFSQTAGYSKKGYISMVNKSQIMQKIENYVNNEIEAWQQKGRYEKLVDYQIRVTEETRNNKIEEFTQNKVNELANEVITLEIENIDYDAENEVFKLVFRELLPVYIKVPISNGDAESFDKNLSKLEFQNLYYTLTPENDFALLTCDIVNSSNKKKYSYNSQESLNFKQHNIVANFGAVKVNIRDKFIQFAAKETTENVVIGKSDVDINIPLSSNTIPNRYALIIGNEDYTKYQINLNSEVNVDFANRDAEIFAEYCEKTLGIPKENIVLVKDAISSQMKREIEKLSRLALYSKGEAELFFYYAGHGFPNEETKESYIMPVDISGSDVTSGIKLSYLYKKLTENPVKSATVFLDACFSGGGRNQGLLTARGVRVKPKENLIHGNLVVFSASTGEQSSLPFKEKQHGMFTYFLLKKLQETKGNVTYDELSNFIQTEVQLNSVKINSKDQNPQTLTSPSLSDEWKMWIFK